MKQVFVLSGFISLIVLHSGCNNPTSGNKKRINFIEVKPIIPQDSLTQAYKDGKYFSPYIIRLNGTNKHGFIFVDSNYFHVEKFEKSTREKCYKKVIAVMPKSDLAIYQRVWAIPEVIQLPSADGGNGTIITTIKERPTKNKKYYIVEIRRNDITDLTPVKDLNFIKINLTNNSLEIATESEYYVSLERWRKVIR